MLQRQPRTLGGLTQDPLGGEHSSRGPLHGSRAGEGTAGGVPRRRLCQPAAGTAGYGDPSDAICAELSLQEDPLGRKHPGHGPVHG